MSTGTNRERIEQNNQKLEEIKNQVSNLPEADKPDQTKTVTPTIEEQVITPDTGYELASVTVEAVTSDIDSNIVSENIKKDIPVLGVTGTLEEGIDTSDATATASDILNPKTAYVNGQKITGSIRPTYESGEITGVEINSTATSSYGISFLLPDNTIAFINQSVVYLKLSNGEIISRNIDLGNYYPHQAEIAELPYEDNKYYFAICSYSSATQSYSNIARIDIFSIDLNVLLTDAYALELEPIKTLSGLYMSYNQGCFTFAKQNGNILAYMERNTTHNLVSIYAISTDSYIVSSKDLGNKELDPNFLKFMNNDRLLVSYVTGYDYNWIFNLTNYTINSYSLLSKNTKISTLDGVNYFYCDSNFYSYNNTDTSTNKLHYGTYNLTNGTTTSVASISFSANVLDVNILYQNENIYYVGVYCDSKMYLLTYDTNTNLFTVLKSTNGYGLIIENTVLSYGYSISLHSIWSGKENLTLGLTVSVEPTDKIVSLTKDDIKYYDTSDATATSDDIVTGETAYSNNEKLVGSMPNNGELNYVPSTEEQIIPAGYTSGGSVAGDSNLVANNIRLGTTIFGVEGNLEAGGGSSDYNAKLVPTNGKIISYITEISAQLDTSSVTDMSYMFDSCTSLTTIPLLDTSSVNDMRNMFDSCTSLTTIPQLDTSSVINMNRIFNNCTSLSDESLNNILVMCKNAVKITSNKTLKYLGLTSEQATKCTTLSNYSTFTSAGWTTGY